MQPNLALINTILAVVLGLAIYGSKRKGYKWLALVLVGIAAHSFLRWGWFQNSREIVVYMPLIVFPISYLVGSAILFYTESVLFDKEKRKNFWYMVPPVTAFFVHIILILVFPDQWTLAHIMGWKGMQRIYILIIGPSMVLYAYGFSLIAFYRIRKYNRIYRENYSDERVNNARWINLFIFCILIFLTVKIVYVAYAIINNLGVPFVLAEELVLLSILLFFMYYFIREPKIQPLRNKAMSDNEKKYANVNLPDKVKKEYVKRLEEYMSTEQVFLDEKISILQIATELDIPQYILSFTINVEFQQNFYNYINKHRVGYAEGLLTDSDSQDESILSIAFESGFQSKSAFNRAFKLVNEMTPSEYRKKHLTVTMQKPSKEFIKS